MTTALGHINVLDLTRVLAGPWATQNLADMGANVIKVERPDAGDDTRAWGPPFMHDANGDPTRDAGYFLSANRGKRSIAVDFATPEGQRIVRDLARDADVLVENYKVGTLARYGLAYEDLRAVNPRLIYCSITGYGQTGPHADRPGYDFVFQGRSGLMSVTGQSPGEPGDEPMKFGVAIADLMAGMYAVTAILAALEHRNVSGLGEYVDIALLDCVVALTSYHAVNFMLSGKTPQRMGNAHPNVVPYQVFRCKEGEIIVACGNDAQYALLCRTIGRGDLADDPRFATMAQRTRNRLDLIPQIAEAMQARTKSEWMTLLESASVPCGPINTVREVFEDPQVVHRGLRIDLPHATGARAPAVGNPIRFLQTPIRYRNAAPTLGEHTKEVLAANLGMSDGEIEALRAKGVIA
jgi:crotonobetainyl-CoA:carnitine CoA-transferase CaiB-like acyl-CoA transferase